MAAAFGTLIERLIGAQVFFAPDGSLCGTTATTGALTNVLKPFNVSAYPDYSLGRVTACKYDPKTKERTREWAASTGGYKERTTTSIVQDAFTFETVDFAPQLIDQLVFGTAALATAGSQQAFQQANRYKDGWFYCKFTNEAGVEIGKLEIHARIWIDAWPEFKNDYVSPKFKVSHQGDGGALDTIIFAVG